MEPERRCTACGRDVREDPNGVMIVRPDTEGRQLAQYFCGKHNPIPPKPETQEERADREQQDLEIGLAALRAEERLIRELVALERPVDPVDRSNMGTELLRMLDRFIYLENKFRVIEGKPLIPTRDKWDTRH